MAFLGAETLALSRQSRDGVAARDGGQGAEVRSTPDGNHGDHLWSATS